MHPLPPLPTACSIAAALGACVTLRLVRTRTSLVWQQRAVARVCTYAPRGAALGTPGVDGGASARPRQQLLPPLPLNDLPPSSHLCQLVLRLTKDNRLCVTAVIPGAGKVPLLPWRPPSRPSRHRCSNAAGLLAGERAPARDEHSMPPAAAGAKQKPPSRRRRASASSSSSATALIGAIAVAVAAVGVTRLLPPAMRDSAAATLANYTVWILQSNRTNSTPAAAAT